MSPDMPLELDIAAIAAILLFSSILAGGIFLRISDSSKTTAHISNTVSIPPWSIGWVNFSLFICVLIICVSFTQSLVAELISLLDEPATIEEALTDERAATKEESQVIKETESANPDPWVLVLSVLSFQVPMVFAFYGLRKTYPATFGGSLNQKSVSIRRAILETTPEFIRCFPVIWLVGLIWFVILTGLRKLGIIDEFPPQQLLTTMSGSENPVAIGLLVVFAVALAPFTEEIIFRGALYRFLKEKTHILSAQIISSSLFAAIHFNLFSFLPLLVIGVLLARIYERKGNILFPMIFHAYWNGFSLLMLFLTNSGSFS